MQRDWFMYHRRSTYKNRLEYPFKKYTSLTFVWGAKCDVVPSTVFLVVQYVDGDTWGTLIAALCNTTRFSD